MIIEEVQSMRALLWGGRRIDGRMHTTCDILQVFPEKETRLSRCGPLIMWNFVIALVFLFIWHVVYQRSTVVYEVIRLVAYVWRKAQYLIILFTVRVACIIQYQRRNGWMRRLSLWNARFDWSEQCNRDEKNKRPNVISCSLAAASMHCAQVHNCWY